MASARKKSTDIKPNPQKNRENASKVNLHYHYGPQYHYHGQSNQPGTSPRPLTSSTVVIVNKNATQNRPNKPQPQKPSAAATPNKGGFQKGQSTHRPQGHNHLTAPIVKKYESPKCQTNSNQQHHTKAANKVVVVNKSGQHKGLVSFDSRFKAPPNRARFNTGSVLLKRRYLKRVHMNGS